MKNPAYRFVDNSQMDAFIAEQGGAWSYARGLLFKKASELLIADQWTEADYEAFDERMNRRTERHVRANERHKTKTGRVGRDESYQNGAETKKRIVRQIGPVVGGIIGRLSVPKGKSATDLASGRSVDTDRRVRGPSRYTAEQRAARRCKTREEAGKAKLPAEIKRVFTMGQLAAFSTIVFRAARFGVCALAVASIAGISAVSARTVQDAVAVAKQQRFISVEEQDDAPNVIRVIDPRILWRYPDGGNFSYPSNRKKENSLISSEIKSPRTGANICPNVRGDEPDAEAVKAKLGAYCVPKVARHLPDPENVLVPPIADEGEEVRQEAAQEADAVMERDKAKAAPPNALEALIAGWRTVVEAENTKPTDPDPVPS